MGTFVIKPTTHSGGGTPLLDGDSPIVGGAWYADDVPPETMLSLALDTTQVHQGQCVAFEASYNNTVRYNFFGLSFYLDGSPTPIAFASLPAGFTPTVAIAKVNPAMTPFHSGIDPDEHAHFYLQHDSGNDGPEDATEYPYDFSGFIQPTILDIYLNGIGLHADLASLPGENAGFNWFFDLRIEGEYEIVGYSWDLQTPEEPVEAGDPVTVTSDPEQELPLDPEQITSVTVTGPDGTTYDVPSNLWTTITPTQFIFTMPSFGGDTPKYVIISITSTQFSGSVTLGTLITIYFTSGSGIYRLVTDKRLDTLYDEDDLPNTIDVAIPTPRAKTGFIGG